MHGRRTWAEIQSQPLVWKDALEAVLRETQDLRSLFRGAAPAEAIVVLGCGSSYYLSLSAAHSLQTLLGVPARAFPSSEAIFYPDTVFPSDRRLLVIGVSRSGETTETVVALRRAAGLRNATLLSVSCRERTGLAGVGGLSLAVPASDEASVVMTRSFSSMLLALLAVGAVGAGDAAALDHLRALPEIGSSLLASAQPLIEGLGRDDSLRRLVYLGSGPLYGIACEAMLKVKEMAIMDSESYHCLEYRHGPKSIADSDTLVVTLLSDVARNEEIQLAKELAAQGARVLIVGPDAREAATEVPGTLALALPGGTLPEWLRTPLAIVPMQLLGFYRAVGRGLDPDCPRNLAQVVMLGL